MGRRRPSYDDGRARLFAGTLRKGGERKGLPNNITPIENELVANSRAPPPPDPPPCSRRAATLTMADDREGADSVLGRMQDQSDAFEAGIDKMDAKLNDGNHYKGLMNVKEYKAKRAELSKDEDTIKREKEDMVRAKIRAERAVADQAVRDREARELARREKIRRELSKPTAGEEAEAPPAKKKKKNKGAGAPTLSFDAEGED